MIKTLQQALKMDREKFKVPRSVQQAIPIQRIWPDGVFQSGTKFSKTFRFSDINYAIASKEDKTEMFLDYSELLNALDSGAAAKITLNNRQINKEEFEASLLLPMKEDGLDEYRKEYNEIKNGNEKAQVLYMNSRALNEPVAWAGPIVMNTQEELQKAFLELRSNTFIKETAEY